MQADEYVTSLSSYQTVKLVAKGLTANIYLAFGPNKEKVALKMFSHKCDKFCINEIRMFSNLSQSKKVVKMLGYGKAGSLETKFGNKRFIAFEYAENGDLLTLLENEGKLGEQNSKEIFLSILECVEAIHNAGMVHRDLKPENVLITSSFDLQITDFGFAEDIEKISRDTKGTPGYIPPEVYYAKTYIVPEAIDIFSLGVILFIMVTGEFPFDNPYKHDPLYKFIVTQQWEEYWKNSGKSAMVSEDLKNLLEGMLCYLPERRMTLEEIRKHSWLKNSVSKEVLKKLIKKRNS